MKKEHNFDVRTFHLEENNTTEKDDIRGARKLELKFEFEKVSFLNIF